MIHPQQMPSPLAPTPAGEPVLSAKVTRKDGSTAVVADPVANRCLVALMNAHALLGGAAAHWGGPSALAEAVAAIHGVMFSVKGRQWHEAFNFVNDAGHCENGVYACRANYGFDGMTLEDLRGFRGIESHLSGHAEQHINPRGVLVSNGPLGSALAPAQGLALSDALEKRDRTTICILTDGAAMEGDARECFASIPGFAARGLLAPFVMVISDNNTKLSGRIPDDAFSMQPTFDSLDVLGWNVILVEKGNDLQAVYTALETALEEAKADPKRPVALWLKTVKGYGIKATEEDPAGGHGFPGSAGANMRAFLAEICRGEANVPPALMEWAAEVERLNAEAKAAKAAKPAPAVAPKKIQSTFSGVMEKLVAEGLPVVSVTSDLPGSTGVGGFRKSHPELSFDVGIAEANMIGLAAGLSKAGYIPVVDTFAQFGITKGNLPLIMCALSGAPVVALFSHNGLQDAADGASHQAITSFAATSAIPLTDVVCCSCAADGAAYLEQALRRIWDARRNGERPRSTIIYMGRENFAPEYRPGIDYAWGKAQVLREPKGDNYVLVSAAGYPVGKALKAAEQLEREGIDACVVQSAFVNRPDVETLLPLLRGAKGRLVTVEDNVLAGGAGAQLIQALATHGAQFSQVRSLGIGDHFGRSAYLADHLYKLHGMDVEHIAAAVREMV